MKLFTVSTIAFFFISIRGVLGFRHVPSLVRMQVFSACQTKPVLRSRLQMVDDAEEGEEVVDDSSLGVSPDIIEGRKQRVRTGYQLMTVAYGLYGILLIPAQAPIPNVAGPFLTAGISYLLMGAAENNRLSSDTYKRLNLALMGYGALTFLSGILGGQLGLLWLVTRFLAVLTSLQGYGYGLWGWDLSTNGSSAKEDIWKGVKSSIQSMQQIPQTPTLVGYWAATIVMEGLKLQKLFELLKSPSGYNLFPFARLLVMTMTLFTLKDAADRNRLEGTTFVALNYMTSLSLAAWAAAAASFRLPLRGVFAAISILTAYNGISSMKRKLATTKE
mmetsp:Transcript_15744/g.23851  ORF Transcript_15744/g.23851 Transcript_15744/m.23851 type:complete len:331 (+) Transcript_15744:109-1101(+)